MHWMENVKDLVKSEMEVTRVYNQHIYELNNYTCVFLVIAVSVPFKYWLLHNLPLSYCMLYSQLRFWVTWNLETLQFCLVTNLAIPSILKAMIKVSFSIQPTLSLAEVLIFSVIVCEVLMMSTFRPGFYKATNLRFPHISIIRGSTWAFINSVI